MLRHGMKLFERSEFFIRCLVFNQFPGPLIFLEFRSGDKSTRQHLGGGGITIFPHRFSYVFPSVPYTSALLKEKMNSVPTPSVLTTLICSSCAWIISFTMESPSPVPFLSLPLDRSDL